MYSCDAKLHFQQLLLQYINNKYIINEKMIKYDYWS